MIFGNLLWVEGDECKVVFKYVTQLFRDAQGFRNLFVLWPSFLHRQENSNSHLKTLFDFCHAFLNNVLLLLCSNNVSADIHDHILILCQVQKYFWTNITFWIECFSRGKIEWIPKRKQRLHPKCYPNFTICVSSMYSSQFCESMQIWRCIIMFL